jgi:hypothetical protein
VVTLALLAASLPFELETAWVALGAISLTNVELLLGLAIVLALVDWLWRDRTLPSLPRSWRWLALLFVAGVLISALFAPAERENALKAAFRWLSGLALAVATMQLVRRRRDVWIVLTGLFAGVSVAAAIGLVEIAMGSPLPWLEGLRPGVTRVGPFLRLTGPFDYANQAAMAFEATLPFAIALAWQIWHSRYRAFIFFPAAALLVTLQAIVLTYSRSGFATVLVVCGLLAVMVWFRAGRARRRVALLAASIGVLMLGVVALNALIDPVFRLRLSSESVADWYRARLDVPAQLTLSASEPTRVAVTLTNQGLLTWQRTGANPVSLAVVEDVRAPEWTFEMRWPLPESVEPGETISFEVMLKGPPREGQLALRWDLVHEGVTWFSDTTGVVATSQATVVGGTGAPSATAAEQPSASGLADNVGATISAPAVGRLQLWRAAWHMWLSRPLSGIGPDNYRLRYGEWLGYETWNQTVHSNNLAIEMLVSLGLVGGAPFLVWLGLLGVEMLLRSSRRVTEPLVLAVAAALLAFLVHGLLDYFLIFNATGLLFWLLVGLWVRLRNVDGLQP